MEAPRKVRGGEQQDVHPGCDHVAGRGEGSRPFLGRQGCLLRGGGYGSQGGDLLPP